MDESQDQTWTTHDGRKVTTIGGLRQTDWLGTRCYAVLTTGDHDAYFAGGTAEILHTTEYRGVRETFYVPDRDNFPRFAAELDQLGAWGLAEDLAGDI